MKINIVLNIYGHEMSIGFMDIYINEPFKNPIA
jgi:hypothetical protein